MTLFEIWDFLSKGGLAAALLFALEGGRRGWYVWKQHYTEAIEERDAAREDSIFWRNKTLKLLETTSKAVDIAGKATDKG